MQGLGMKSMNFHTNRFQIPNIGRSYQIMEGLVFVGGLESGIYCILLLMQITLAHIGNRGGKNDAFDGIVCDYLKRCIGLAQCITEAFRSEKALLDWVERQRGRTRAVVLMLDARGRQMTSEALAAWLGKQRDEGAQHIVFAVGPADGWSEAAREEGLRRGGLLSLGPMTLAHQLARLVMAEQIYRACTILTGHPYHRGHS